MLLRLDAAEDTGSNIRWLYGVLGVNTLDRHPPDDDRRDVASPNGCARVANAASLEPTRPGEVRIAAVGDILLNPVPQGPDYARSTTLLADDVGDLFGRCDLVVGNLEFTLPGDGSHVASEPRLIATAAQIAAVKSASFDIVSLANNHTFDCFDAGFQNTARAVEDAGILHFGAGMNVDQAKAAVVVERNSVRLAFVGAVDASSGMSQFAADGKSGVAPLDIDQLVEQIAQLRSQVDHVVVAVHWGQERFYLPSPVHVKQAHRLVDAGASIVLGHHPHVVQGFEVYQGAPIIYSLGNFLADEVHFSGGGLIQWRGVERCGCVLVVTLNKDGTCDVRQIPTFDTGRTVQIDTSGLGQRHLDRVNRALARGVTAPRYRRESLRVKFVMPTLRRLHWSEWSKLRPRHVRGGIQALWRSLRTG
jgi:poly-gamma-glutamate synthesis protein (capsule biosynthesis protein)